MTDRKADLFVAPKPTADRPLLGQTVLAVEDSRAAGEALRLMCLKSGARFRRADSLAAASRHLRTYRPGVMIVDMGLPDGSGAALIEQLANVRPRVPVLLALSGDAMALRPALEAGADGILTKPLASLAAFQSDILSRLPETAVPAGPRALPEEEIAPDPAAVRDDLRHVATLLDGPEAERTLAYAAGFALSLGRSCADTPLIGAAEALGTACRHGTAPDPARRRLATLVRARIDTFPANAP